MTKINDELIDNLAHKMSDILGAHGVDLSNTQKYDFADIVSEFIRSSLGVEVEEQDPTLDSDLVNITFDIICGRATQSLKIFNDAYTPESIVEGLKSGKLVTTMEHLKSKASFVMVNRTNEHIALICEQTTDVEMADFE